MTRRGTRSTAFIIIAVGLVCIAIGVYRGEIITVLNNAIVVCLECIGIG